MRTGYAHVRVTDLAETKDHYANTLGLYEVLEEDGRVCYKGWDELDHHSVVFEEGGVGLVKVGFTKSPRRTRRLLMGVTDLGKSISHPFRNEALTRLCAKTAATSAGRSATRRAG
jgi:hypothetical protein